MEAPNKRGERSESSKRWAAKGMSAWKKIFCSGVGSSWAMGIPSYSWRFGGKGWGEEGVNIAIISPQVGEEEKSGRREGSR